MVDFALSSNRLIGMIQTNSNGGFYSIGSFGKINSFSETNDKRYIINLYGLNYFKIEKELNREENFIIANVKIVNSGLWQVMHLYKTPFTLSDINLLINSRT